MDRVLLVLIAATMSWLAFSTSQALDVSPFVQKETTVLSANTASFSYEPSSPNLDKLYEEINELRADKGLKPLRANQQLTDIANLRAKDMKARKYYSHLNPDGLYYYDLMKNGHINTEYSCENLNLGFAIDTKEHINSWLGSRSHKACMLNSHTEEAGYAVAEMPGDSFSGFERSTFIVVAIYSTPIEQSVAISR